MSTDNRPRGVIRLREPRNPVRPDGPPPTLLTRADPQARIAGRGVLQANLNWLPEAGADLNLCCLVSSTDGSATVVQSLGDDYGSLTSPPYVALDHDDRTGESSDGETLRVSIEHHAAFKRLLFFVYIYEGAADFRDLGAVATVTAPSGDGCRILLDDSPPGSTACAVALVAPDNGGLSVRREVRWFTGWPVMAPHRQINDAYGFGIESWTTMEKRRR
ncbi:hypothetical protein [Streptomyces agglomeratus]|uniref:hypothetical protein n=1 Tax=Streptomyces agglomeratus TaxID=285458 RepID=UPI0008548926|nr:hypothetical protein [Streptomyces agglomeratus]OEJ51869.1 hypothetical protein BGK72_14945 [Streptomyces agglomeratus]